jgi:putative ABC transport system substrate-binding protein
MPDVRRRQFIALLGGAAAWPLATRAQEPAHPVIGYLSARSPDDTWHLVEAFRRGLREGGFVEGQNATIEYRWGLGERERLAELASDLVRKPVSVLVTTGGEGAALAAKAATSTIPIAFVVGGRSSQTWACRDLQSARRKRHGNKYFDRYSGA